MTDKDNGHRPVAAKVKIYVDSGIKELVELLNELPYLATVSSCEGTSDKFRGHVYIESTEPYSIDFRNRNYFSCNSAEKEKIIDQADVDGAGYLARFGQVLFSKLHKYQFKTSSFEEQPQYPGILGEIIIELVWHADILNEHVRVPFLNIEFPHDRIKQLTDIVREIKSEILEEKK